MLTPLMLVMSFVGLLFILGFLSSQSLFQINHAGNPPFLNVASVPLVAEAAEGLNPLGAAFVVLKNTRKLMCLRRLLGL